MWLYNDEVFTPEMIGDNYGFIYSITNTTNHKIYIGRKYFYSKRTLPPLKGYKRKRHIVKDSGWESYWSSSKVVHAEIKLFGKDNFERKIITLHPNKTETNYHELKLQFHLNVLEAIDEQGNRIYYNENINTKFYPSKAFHQERLDLHEKYYNLYPGLPKPLLAMPRGLPLTLITGTINPSLSIACI
jgi:hypothetical protein